VADRPHPFRRWSNRLLRRGQQPWLGWWLGLGLTALIALIVAPFEPSLGRSVAGFLLVIPVVIAAVVGGRTSSYAVAVVAGLSYSLHLPPIGSPRIALAEDVVAMIVLLGVGLIVSTLVTGRIEALRRLDRDRALLLRSVSHDLRTPLGTIRAAASDLLDESADEADPATVRHLLQLIDHDAQRLDRLVANLLSLSRIEADAMRPSTMPTDVAALASRVVQRWQMEDGVVDVVLEAHGAVGTATVDPVMIEQVIMNLVDNAVRHSAPGMRVDVDVRPGDTGGVRIEVADRGPGVTAQEAALIFQPFRSGQMAGSSGVGLAICRAIVTAHDGTIAVHERPGGGAAFVVDLPD
jgi:K+-sensing histidine kinase KdpD